MIIGLGITFYLGIALYVVAGVAALVYLWRAVRSLDFALWTAAIGAACLTAAFFLRWAAWGLAPMTTVTDSIVLLAVMATVGMLVLVRQRSVRALACFYLPPLAAVCAVSAAVAHNDLFTAPRALLEGPLILHVGLAFLAYAMFFLAGMTSAAYIYQSHRLKQRKITGLFQRLPSLERLDHTLSRLVSIGYPLFLITLVLGGIWAYAQRELLGPQWWLAPKVVLSFVMAAFYALAFHARRSGRLRGPKLAFLVLAGFAFLLVTYLVLALLNLRTYNFWESGV